MDCLVHVIDVNVKAHWALVVIERYDMDLLEFMQKHNNSLTPNQRV